MAIPVARVHLKVAHAALPALLPTPPKWKMLRLLTAPCPCLAAAVLPKPLAKSSRADSVQRWDAHKTKSASTESPASSSPRSSPSCAGRGSSSKSKNATSPPKAGRADSAERWDAHKKAASPASSSPPSSSVSRASSTERWDVHKMRCQPQAEQLDDVENSSSTGSNDDIDDTEEEEILWKPRALYAGPGFVVAAPEPSMIPMPAAFLVPVA